MTVPSPRPGGGLKVLFFAALLLLHPRVLPAVDVGDRVQVHGFLSQGYLYSSKNDFLGDTKGGTFEFREAGINLNAQLTDTFRVGGQLLYCHFAESSNGNFHIDWLVAEYHASDPFGVRLGKVKLPMGLYNMERDSDFLRPLIFLPQSIYDETRRDSWQSHWGGEFYGNLLLGGWGDVDYQLFGGRISYDDDSLATQAVAEIVGRYNAGRPVALSVRSLRRENHYIYGGALYVNSALPGLRGGLTFLALDDEARIHGTQVSTLRVKAKFVVSLEYSWRQFSISSEYCETDRVQEQFGETALDGRSRAWYLLLSYSPVEEVTFSLFYDEYYRLIRNRHQPVGARNPYPWRKDLAAALRYDLSEQWTFKAEWHIVDGTAFYMSYFNPEGAARHWQYGALKITFNF